MSAYDSLRHSDVAANDVTDNSEQHTGKTGSMKNSPDLEKRHPLRVTSRPLFLCLLCVTALCMMLLITIISLLPSLHSASALPSFRQPLRFAKDGTFQVCVFEDLHFGEAEDLDWGPQQDINSTRVMNSVLDSESPQLVVLNGDLITGENTYLFNSTYYVDRIVQPMVQRGLEWASTYGKRVLRNTSLALFTIM